MTTLAQLKPKLDDKIEVFIDGGHHRVCANQAPLLSSCVIVAINGPEYLIAWLGNEPVIPAVAIRFSQVINSLVGVKLISQDIMLYSVYRWINENYEIYVPQAAAAPQPPAAQTPPPFPGGTQCTNCNNIFTGNANGVCYFCLAKASAIGAGKALSANTSPLRVAQLGGSVSDRDIANLTSWHNSLIKTKSKSSGMNCSKCNEFNQYAEANRADGKFVCYGCRH